MTTSDLTPEPTDAVTATASRSLTLSAVAIAQALLDLANTIRETHLRATQ